MIQITSKYTSLEKDVAFLQIKQTEVSQIPHYLTFFYIHVSCAIFALLAGFTQFNHYILTKQTIIHRNIGKMYVLIILFLAAPSGFVIGLYANGGFYSKIAFVLLSVLWFYFTLKGFIKIKNRNITAHKAFMIRSFALTFSAITLRMWKVILVYLFQPSPMDLYQIIAWLGWIPNLLIVEFYIIKKFQK
ncbi:DUF2306 domain-containing protein [Flavobacterium sp.]|uniref:DUF2306 domain-containing protein n=1 Tax=Flavobacterium sp. TaxID=239 RepID=UPI003750F7B3